MKTTGKNRWSRSHRDINVAQAYGRARRGWKGCCEATGNGTWWDPIPTAFPSTGLGGIHRWFHNHPPARLESCRWDLVQKDQWDRGACALTPKRSLLQLSVASSPRRRRVDWGSHCVPGGTITGTANPDPGHTSSQGQDPGHGHSHEGKEGTGVLAVHVPVRGEGVHKACAQRRG